ncbi:hypothetical protein ACJ73_08803 [Blastomyces percursus]|uniref:Protein kinase domain-containing protein n=1 Tax=Blastomyces percursus TaxID=1658174 RepID=A0A1J9PLU1_9EURO|nr:hypothetical protein ACJ73_08803 [Blastomyces percursus]
MASGNFDRDELLRQLADARRTILEAQQLVEKERERAERERERAEKERERAVRAEADKAPTVFERYLLLVQQRLVSTLSVEPNPAKTASDSLTSVDRKYYPLELCVWVDFEEEHSKTFSLLTSLLSDKPLFPCENDVLGVQREMSPSTRKDEQDIRPFIRSAIEKPAARVVMAYLGPTGSTDEFYFQNNAYSLENKTFDGTYERETPPPNKRRSPEPKSIRSIPDRWGICESTDGHVRCVLVGEYKAAHKIHIEGFTQALRSPPKDLFLEVLRRKQYGTVNAEGEKVRERVAQVLCQAFHYMITSGLLYGYVASGEALVFLKIHESAPEKLYFYLTPVATKGPVQVQFTPAAQLATFAMLALRSTAMSRDWVKEAEQRGICQWPLLPPSPLQRDVTLRPREFGGETSESSEEEEDTGDRDYTAPSKGRSRSRSQLNRPSQSGGGERRRSPRKRTTTERPVLTYCTQACLLGLVQGLPLDTSCPNVLLHQRGRTSGRHLITKEDLCLLVKKQLAHSLDKDCKCLDREGLFGAIGVLFKITLTKYGYTFVAKGVQRVDEPCLANEASVYAHLSDLQGMKIPVCLGNITLERSYPLISLARVTQMMLMSWAGSSLSVQSWPEDVDIEVEKEKTEQALMSSGVSHNDIRNANMVWNPELRQVMAIDFDQATIHRVQKRKASASPSGSRKSRTERGETRMIAATSKPAMRNSGKENLKPSED